MWISLLCVFYQGSMRRVYMHSKVNLQRRRELQQHFQWDRWMKFIKHVTVNTPSREKTLQRINKCWLYQPLPPVIYPPESTFLLGMNYGNKWLSLLWSLWMPSSCCMCELYFSNCYIDYRCWQASKWITYLIWRIALRESYFVIKDGSLCLARVGM